MKKNFLNHFSLKNNKELLFIFVIYLMTHFMLLIVSGRWWDEWTGYNRPEWVTKEFATMLGHPDTYYLSLALKGFSEHGLRIMTFCLYYLCAICFYRILTKGLCISNVAAMWITALYVTFPANDARILCAVFSYTLGHTIWLLATCLLIHYLDDNSGKLYERIICLLLFFLSFTLNSNLVFYGLALLIIVYNKKTVKCMVTFADFLVLPFVFFFGQRLLVPSRGAYSDYNQVDASSLFSSIIGTIKANFDFFRFALYNIYKQILHIGSIYFMIVLLVFAILTIVLFTIKHIFEDDIIGGRDDGHNIKYNLTMILIGIVIMSAGLFSYVVVRHRSIDTSGIAGRDSILAICGAAIVVYFLVAFIKNKYCRLLILVGLLDIGILYFNIYYLSYQQDYYRQLGLIKELQNEEQLINCNNIQYVNDDNGLINIQSTYQLNALAEIAYGGQNRCVSATSSFESYDDMQNQSLAYRYLYHMTEYTYSDSNPDATIYYMFESDLSTVILLKYYELFDDKEFDKLLKRKTTMKVKYYNK